MSGDDRRPVPAGIGGLTRRDHYREAALTRVIADNYRGMSSAASARGRRRHLRSARRHERALVAQRRRPQSVLSALALGLVVVLAALVATRASFTLAIIAAALLLVDVRVLRRRRRLLRRT